jgi:DNA-binding NarL/FixJ family response regulator
MSKQNASASSQIFTANGIHPTDFRLTERQMQVLLLLCNRGLPNKRIATVLDISESTVKVHVSAILKAYGVHNRTQLAIVARVSLVA